MLPLTTISGSVVVLATTTAACIGTNKVPAPALRGQQQHNRCIDTSEAILKNKRGVKKKTQSVTDTGASIITDS